ncbi:MAG: thioredoxin family protein [Pirellulales bacterium]
MIHLTLNILLQAAAVTAGGEDYTVAYKQMTETGKPLVVLIGADWCPGCRQMKQSTMPEVEKRGGLNNVSFAYVNTDEQSALAGKLMQGSSIPQLVLFYKTDSGWKRQQLTGAHGAGEIQRFIEKSTDASVPKISSRP